jgi:hypothetical protein
MAGQRPGCDARFIRRAPQVADEKGMDARRKKRRPIHFCPPGALSPQDPADVDAGIAAALAHNGPVLVDAVVSRTVLPIPPAITAEMAKGFTLYMVKAVFSSRGDDLSRDEFLHQGFSQVHWTYADRISASQGGLTYALLRAGVIAARKFRCVVEV